MRIYRIFVIFTFFVYITQAIFGSKLASWKPWKLWSYRGVIRVWCGGETNSLWLCLSTSDLFEIAHHFRGLQIHKNMIRDGKIKRRLWQDFTTFLWPPLRSRFTDAGVTVRVRASFFSLSHTTFSSQRAILCHLCEIKQRRRVMSDST